MKHIRILHTADLHIDTTFFSVSQKAELLKHELLEAFGRIVNIAKEKNVDAILISGDITDNGTMSEASYKFMCEAFNKISHIPVFAILGNHDFGFNYTFPENVHLFGTDLDLVSLKDADIYGASFNFERDISPLKELVIKDNDKINIMLCHGTLNGNTDNPFLTSDIEKSGLNYLALGHIHSFEGLDKKGMTYYCYSGVPMGRGFDELGEKGVIIADIYENTVEAEFVPLGSRKFVELSVDCAGLSNYIEVADKVYESTNEKDLYKVVLKGTPSGYINVETLNSVLQEKLFYAKVVDKTKAEVNIEELAKEQSLVGYFVKNAMNNQKALEYGLKALNGERIYTDED
ncbi:MAG: DNA repair exonuclease [Clostridia bacterium]|nr:DNA repair exonuclease [Clostridia bacterium]